MDSHTVSSLKVVSILVKPSSVAAYVRVSTDGDEQLESFRSQKQYYQDKISENRDWVMVGIYADEAITGTKVDKREQFQRMIQDCMDGKIDVIMTKSVSRFSRNTVDILQYVRLLKGRGIAVIFEKEYIPTAPVFDFDTKYGAVSCYLHYIL